MQGGVTLYGFDAAGDANDLDFGSAVDAITLRLAGLGTKDGAAEAARLVVYDADGDALDIWVIAANGANSRSTARRATIEALD